MKCMSQEDNTTWKPFPYPVRTLKLQAVFYRGQNAGQYGETIQNRLHTASLMRPPGGLPWLPFTVMPICIVGVSNMCTGTWKCGGTFSNASRFCPQQSDRLLKYGLTTFEHWAGSFQSLEVEKMVFVDFQWTHMGSTCVCCLCESYQHNQTGWLVTNTGWRMGCDPIAVCDQPGNQHEQEMPGYCGCVWFVRMLLKPNC